MKWRAWTNLRFVSLCRVSNIWFHQCYGVASSCLGVFVKFHSKKARAAMGAVRCVSARQSPVAGAGPSPPSEYEYATTDREEFVGFTSLYDEFRGYMPHKYLRRHQSSAVHLRGLSTTTTT